MPVKHRKIYYRPGWISLIVVPCLFYYFGNKQIKTLNNHVLEVNWYNKRHWDTTTKKYNFLHCCIPERNVLELRLTGNLREDEHQLQFGTAYIRKIIAEKDTVHAIHFHLSDQCKYATMVSILDVCNINLVNSFVVSDSGILMYYETPPEAMRQTHLSENEKRVIAY